MRTALPSMTAVALWIGMSALTTAQPSPERVTVKFSDPSRPGKLRMDVMLGSITIRGENRQDVSIEARTRGGSPIPPQGDPPPGFRRLTQNVSFSVEEERNELTVSTPVFRAIHFEIHVPARTNLELSMVNGQDIVVDAVEGEIEVSNVNGGIRLTNIAGSVVANSVNGQVSATLTRVTPQKAMAFTSLNGTVDVTLPSSVKANLKLRSDRGDVFTDFDLQIRPGTPAPVEDTRQGRGRFRIDVNNAIYGSINGGGPEIEIRTFNGSVYVRKGP